MNTKPYRPAGWRGLLDRLYHPRGWKEGVLVILFFIAVGLVTGLFADWVANVVV